MFNVNLVPIGYQPITLKKGDHSGTDIVSLSIGRGSFRDYTLTVIPIFLAIAIN